MPCYDYKCPSCEYEFEKIVSQPNPDKKEPCPKCHTLAPTFYPIGRNHHLKFLFNYMAPDA